MNDSPRYRHAKSEQDVYLDDSNPNTESKPIHKAKSTSTKKKKKKYKFRWGHIIPAILVLVCLIFAFYIYSSTKTNGPVYGQRCQSALTLDESKINAAKDLIQQDASIENVTIEVTCLTVKMDFTMASGVSIEDAKTIATNALATLDSTLGYEKNSEKDTYSKVFSMDGDTRQYDVEMIIYGDQAGYPIFATKQYKNNDITFTDANVKDQSVVDSIASQGSDE